MGDKFNAIRHNINVLTIAMSLYVSLNNVKILNLNYTKKSLVIPHICTIVITTTGEEDDAVLKLPGFKHCMKTYLLNCVLLNKPQLTLYNRLQAKP